MLYSEATEELAEFAEAFGIPVAETQAGKSAFLEPSAECWRHRRDRLTGSEQAGETSGRCNRRRHAVFRFYHGVPIGFSNPKFQFININLNSMDASKMGGEAIPADQRRRGFAKELQDRQYRSAYGATEIADLRDEWNAKWIGCM